MRALCVVAAMVLLGACGRKSGARVTIDSPAEGDTVRGSAVHVTLTATGVELAPAADERPGTAHHHLFLDVEPTPLDQKIPAGVAGIIHLGRAQTEYHWDSVAAGSPPVIPVRGARPRLPPPTVAGGSVRFLVASRSQSA